MAEAQVTDFYILFHNHTEGMQLYSYLRARKLKARICPVPRAASACCGMSLIVAKEDVEAVRAATEESGIDNLGFVELPRNIDPKRDRYC